ncbi:hypothetical protein ACN261_27970 [Micromonospora sp. WMMD723]|uniref:hypothetical protein n=1 Tax=Micromonospora sp. WMMD723 TaxID=3403465 RepID=UPI003CE83498
MVVTGGPQGGVAVPAVNRRSGVAATVGAVVAVLLLVALALAVALVGMFLPMAADGCGTEGTEGTEGLLICGPAGQLVVLGAPTGGALLGVLLALVGFLPMPLRHRRALFIGVGYLVVLGGLGVAFLVAFSGW